jgi:tetratricopeptide (TPR) repeat protein
MLDTIQSSPDPATPNIASAREAGETFLDLLAKIEQSAPDPDRHTIAAAYSAWIDRNTPATNLLHAAWFNLAVDLGETGEDEAARHAYRMALELRPDFHPAALNLGVRIEAGGDIVQALAVWHQALQPDDLRATLLAERHRLTHSLAGKQPKRTILHVGCGGLHADTLPAAFQGPKWHEHRIDITPAATADPWAGIADATIDAGYAPHCLARLAPHQIQPALQSLRRALKSDGIALLTTPDLQEVARHVAEGRLDDTLYQSPLGPIAAHDILFGHRGAMAAGQSAMAHHTGFTEASLAAAIVAAGFAAALVQRDIACFNLLAIGFATKPDEAGLTQAAATMLHATAQPPVFYCPSP